ncbi:U3 small nucleolar RNA-associated protein 15 [Golovinomyces cichoracearum]|uniref:U3 small nucleolar RNA-associated protein 15 n=1 Tax=Golovinomyces cichoracearum TaxID=62708 RepID=A0A420IY19_9PEZI|nr:U3 small nucleolar RNA-associated protein 15 [Golovinomyces cichoracearum]
MANPVPKFQVTKGPSGPSPVTPEQRYWKGFRSPLYIPFQSPVTHISFTPPSSSSLLPANDDYFVATSGARLQIYSIRTRKLVKIISRFTDIAHSGEIRRDGRIVVAGDETGKIQVFDVQSRAILKTWEEHKQPVWTTKFSPITLTTLMSTSDDYTARIWDLPTGESTIKFTGHTDYVRSGCFMPGTMSNLILTGSYDNTVRLWDPRIPEKATMTFKHTAPVEDVLSMPSGTQIAAAAGNQISILDVVAGKPLQILKNHQKTVTSLCLASNGTRLVTGGLDGHVKIFETTGWNNVYGSKYSSPVLTVNVVNTGASKEDKHLIVGLQSGMMSVKTRLSGQEKVKQREREKEMQALVEGTLEKHDRNTRKRTRGLDKVSKRINFVGEGAEVVIEGQERRRQKAESTWEKNLRQGKYAKALDQVLENKLSSATVLSVFIHLRHRSALRTALEGRDEFTVQPVFKWISKHLADPRYVSICTDVSLLLLDIYSEHVGDSIELERMTRALHNRVRAEVVRAQQACQVSGMLRLLMTEVP